MKRLLIPTLLTITLLLAACTGMQSHDGAVALTAPGITDVTEAADVADGADGGEEMPVIGISDKTAGVITPIACPVHPDGDEVEGETYSCGTFTVPLDYSDPTGNALDMTFMVLKSTGDNPQPDPLVQLVGGPGQSGLLAGGLGLGYEQVRAQRDLIFTSVRGTKFSQRIGIEQCFGTAKAQGVSEEESGAVVDSIASSEDVWVDADEIGIGRHNMQTGNGRRLA